MKEKNRDLWRRFIMHLELNKKETELILCALEGLKDIETESSDFFENKEEYLKEIEDIKNLYRKIKLQIR